MAQKIMLTVQVKVPGGPTVGLSRPVEAEAYDYLEVAVKPADKDVEVMIQPGAAVKLLLITVQADLYSDKLKCKVYKGDVTVNELKLDGPQLFLGVDAAKLLGGGSSPQKLTLDNAADGKECVVQILVCRDKK